MRIPPRFALVAAALLACVSCSTPKASARPGNYLLVLNKAEATLMIIEPNSGHVRRTLPVGVGPHEVAVSKDGRRAVVADYGDQRAGRTLTVIDLLEERVERTIDLTPHQRPHGITFLDQRSTVVVTSETSKAVLVVDVEGGRVERVLDTGADISHMLALAPDGKTVYTANIASGSVSAIDVASGRSLGIRATGNKAEAIAVSPDGREVWVGHNQDHTVVVLDAKTLEEKAKIACGPVPIRICFTPDGERALVTLALSGQMAVIDTKTRRETARVDFGRLTTPVPSGPGGQTSDNPMPVGILVEPRGRYACVALCAKDRVAIVDLETLKVGSELTTGHVPDGMAWSDLRHELKLEGGR